MTQEDKPKEIQKTRDCYKLINSQNLKNDTNQIKVNNQTSISKVAFMLVKKMDESKDKVF